ncbi:MAG: VWA domain-containing protein [Polyangiaceae bacterium]|nr:VWA domain-containing protein [Polyangiaceae bacterium]
MRLGPLVLGDVRWLWLLVPVFILAAIDLWRGWGARGQRWRGMIVRALVLSTLAVALADPRWERRRQGAYVIFVVDRSASISDAGVADAMSRVEALRGPLGQDVRVGLVVADGSPTVAVMPGEPWRVPEALRGERSEATDLSAALDMARALVPSGDSGQIVLLSDGRPTAGERRVSVIAPRLQGLPVHTVTIAPERKDAAITAVLVDNANVRPGATTSGTIEVDGGIAPFKGEVLLRVDGKVVKSQRVELEAGESKKLPFEASVPLGTPEGELAVEAELVPDGAADPQAHAAAAVAVGQKPKVLLLAAEPKDGELLASALRAEAMEIEVRTLEARNFPKEIEKETDLVIIANAPAAAVSGQRGLSEELLTSLAKWVDAGGGLVVLGGPRAFDLGGYAGTPIERVLPIRLDPVDPLTEPAATIIAVLDQSGSMGAHAGGKTKMELADEAVFASVQMLRPFDYVGLTTVTTEASWDVKVQPVADALDLEKKILSIRSEGGGIYVYTGIEAAFTALKDAPTPLKHVLLFSDCADSEEKVSYRNSRSALDLASEQRAAGVTLSVIGIGEETDPDTAWLKQLAEAGGGKFYLTNDATKLRALFVEETERIVDSSVQEGDFRPQVATQNPMTAGIDYANAPMLNAYQRLTPRKTSETVLLAPGTDPLLVTWRYGLGHVVVWSSDAGGRWAKNWIAWEGFNKQWTQIARYSLRTKAGGTTAVEVDFSGGEPIARLVRRDPSGMTLDGRARLRLKSGGSIQELSLKSREPGLYEAKIDVPPSGVHALEVVDDDDKVIHTERFVVPPPEERRHRTADTAWLQDLSSRTAGTVDVQALNPALAPSSTPEHLRLWPFVALAAALLIPLDAALRRMARVV